MSLLAHHLDAKPVDMPKSPSPSLSVHETLKEVWMEDGNVVLTSGDGGHRVHRSFIGENSLVLQDMFKQRMLGEKDAADPPILVVSAGAATLSHYVNARYNKDG